MNLLRTIIFIILLLSVYFGISVFVGIKWAIAVFSLILISIATAFIIKKDFYAKYIKFVNPKAALLYGNKDDDFRRKLRITDIIVCYIISAILLFLAAVIPNVTLTVQGSIPIYLIIATVLITILIWCFSLFILKKSKKNSSFWFYFIALILSMALLLSAFQAFIF